MQIVAVEPELVEPELEHTVEPAVQVQVQVQVQVLAMVAELAVLAIAVQQGQREPVQTVQELG